MTITLNDMNNLVILTGHLAEDAKVTKLSNGGTLVTLRLATNENWQDKEGNYKSKAHFHDIKVWDKLAERVGEYKKGDAVQCAGKLVSNEKSEGKDGKNYYNTYVQAESIRNFARKETEVESEQSEAA